METKRYELLFSDLEVGHPELGWVKRKPLPTSSPYYNEDEDLSFVRMLHRKGIDARVVEGIAYVEV